nr:S-layer homology domain-containing protein [Collinsella sp. AF38-3AC]
MTEDTPYAKEIWWLARQKISTGYPDSTFRPDVLVARCDLAAMLWPRTRSRTAPRSRRSRWATSASPTCPRPATSWKDSTGTVHPPGSGR